MGMSTLHVHDAWLGDGTWPMPEQPRGRSLVGRLANIVQLEKYGRYQAACTLRSQTLVWFRKVGQVPAELTGLEAALEGLEPLGPWVDLLRGSDVRFDV